MEVDNAIQKIVEFINESNDPKSEETVKAIRTLKELLELRDKLHPKSQVIEVEKPEKKRISPETVAILQIVIPAITSIAGILIIIKYEQMNILTSKALGFIMRSR